MKNRYRRVAALALTAMLGLPALAAEVGQPAPDFDLSGGKGLNLAAVNVDQKPEDAKTFLNDNTAKFTVAFDQGGNTAEAHAIKGMPTSVLIGTDGKVLMAHNGFTEEQRGELEKQIKQALNLKD